MIKSNYLLLSEGITLDQITWLASVYNILERFQSPEFPLVIPKIAMLAFFEKKNETSSKFEIERKLFNNNNELWIGKQLVDFQDKQKHKWLNIIQVVEIKEPWELSLTVYYEWKEINKYIIEVVKVNK